MRLAALIPVLCAVAFAQPTVVVYSAAGEQSSAIEQVVRSFREDLGALNANEPQTYPGGRREINWDGVGGRLGEDNLAGDFFASRRGLLMSTPGTRLKVSGDSGTPSFLLQDITPDQTGFADFEPFSRDKIFAPIGSNTVDIEFRIPGGGWQQACSNGFGAIFLDVDRSGHAYLEAVLSDGTTRKVLAPAQNVRDKGMSFAAIRVINGCIVNVRIVTGQAAIDVRSTTPAETAALDDFIYGEPRALPRTPAGTQSSY